MEFTQDIDESAQGLEQHSLSLHRDSSRLNASTSGTGQGSEPEATRVVYYPQASSRSPDVSHLPLPANLDFSVELHLAVSMDGVPGLSLIDPFVLKTEAQAFELAVPCALMQSVHHYFSVHLAKHCQRGLDPVFYQVELINKLSQQGGQTTYVSTLIQEDLAADNDYSVHFETAASMRTLQRVVMHVEWQQEGVEDGSDEEDSDEEGVQPDDSGANLPLLEAILADLREAGMGQQVAPEQSLDEQARALELRLDALNSIRENARE